MRREGFTLVELMIVVAIIAIIAAIAIPSLQESRKSAIETHVIGTLRAMVTVNEQYRVRNGVYASDLSIFATQLPQTAQNASLDAYTPVYQSNGSTWSLQAAPKNAGYRSFWVDTSGVIRVNPTGLATSTSPPLD